jgi:hypothetical protein
VCASVSDGCGSSVMPLVTLPGRAAMVSVFVGDKVPLVSAGNTSTRLETDALTKLPSIKNSHVAAAVELSWQSMCRCHTGDSARGQRN